METIIRYKNGTLYSTQAKHFLNYKAIISRSPGAFTVIDSAGKKDVTLEVIFLAEVELVKKTNAYHKARVVYAEEHMR